GVGCEKDGVRVELVSGCITPHEVWYVYSVLDLEKQFEDDQQEIYAPSDSIGTYWSFQQGYLYHDPDQHETLRMGHFTYNDRVDLTDREVTLTLGGMEIGGKTLPGAWELVFPLSAICPEAKPAGSAETADAAVKEAAAADAAVPDTGLVQKMREDFNQFNLWQFFGNWAQGNVDDMVYGLNITHKLNGEASKARVKELLKSGTPLNYQINDVRSESGEKVYTCTVELDPGSGENPRCERFEVRINTDVMNERYGIDLNSFDNGQPAEMDPALETVSLSRETYINNYLEYFSPGIREKMLPIGLTCEGNGIRMELISGLLKGGEEYIFYSLEDLEGKYDLGSMDTMDLSESIGKWESYSSSPVYRDKTARKVYFIWNPHYGNQPVDLTDRTVTLKLKYLDILQNCWVNIAELVEQYGKITEGVPAPEGTSEWDVQKGEFVTPEGAMVLDHRNPLDIQVFPNLKITGIGWIDDRLHVQVCEKNMTRASLDFGHMVRSELFWYEAENGGSYTEVIFNIKPDSERIKDIYFCPRIGQERIFGPWRIEFPLSAICPETAEQAPQANADDEVRPVEKLDEDYGNMNLDEREGKITFDVYANTEVYTQDGIGYALKEDGTAEVMGTSVIMADLKSIRIPKTVNGHTVTAIGTSAFGVYSDLESVFLPDSVQTIRNCAFEGCLGLKSLRIPEGVTSIDSSVFLNCINLTDVTIPDSVTVIESQAFSGCKSLASVSIPAGTFSIGKYAFV
ncbi:MAG: leucine-rich repeat domain-containing protein, partial [Clostridia bacterium]|nr:leucine-rich repeat domain-containing protein [Clostridia bacterium]